MKTLDAFSFRGCKSKAGAGVAPLTVQRKIRAFHKDMVTGKHHRYRSWEHCYAFFRRLTSSDIVDQRDAAALQLGFFLASWGMYRGSSFLLQRDYTVHLAVIDCIATLRSTSLWEPEFGSRNSDLKLIPLVRSAINKIRAAYKPDRPTNILVTKVMLGTLGCLPACDQFFIKGFKSHYPYSKLNGVFLERLLEFSRDNSAVLEQEAATIETVSGIRYPIMKVVDMYFWQTGRDLARRESRNVAALRSRTRR
jgi:hypothetical protein